MKLDKRLIESIRNECEERGQQSLGDPIIRFIENFASRQIKQHEVSNVLSDIYELMQTSGKK